MMEIEQKSLLPDYLELAPDMIVFQTISYTNLCFHSFKIHTLEQPRHNLDMQWFSEVLPAAKKHHSVTFETFVVHW